MNPKFRYDAPHYPLSVVVLSHNCLDELTRNIPELIRSCEELGYELIVVDNASREEVRSYLSMAIAPHHNAVLLQNLTNLGVAGGRNTAYAVVNGEFILSIDDDTRVSCETLRALPDLMRQKYPQVGILALRVRHAETYEDQNYAGEYERLVGNHHGAACVIHREVLARVGGIDDYCTFGSEEIDLCIRAHASGYQILYTPALVVFHNNILRLGNDFLRRVKMRVFNNARTMHKYFPLPMASLFADRYLGHMALKWIVERDAASLCALSWASVRGRWLGLRHRTPVPSATVTYYADPSLVPDFGNRPFFRQRIRKFFKCRE